MHAWNPKHLDTLSKLSATLGPQLDQLLTQLEPGQRQQLLVLTSSVQEQLCLGQLTLLGYDAAQAGHTAFGTMKLAPASQGWAQAHSRQALASSLAGMLAGSLCAVLETCVSEFSYGNPELELHRRQEGSQWVRQLEQAFELELDAPLGETLMTLIDARREAASEPHVLAQQADIALLYAAWPQACVLLATRLAQQLASRAHKS